MSFAFLFPGQGSQSAGMGQALAARSAQARAVFDEVDEALGEKLSTLMFEGPEETLTLTANAQPALMAVSLAFIRAIEHEFDTQWRTNLKYVAGHSLGEYAALAAVGSLSIANTARLLRIRGNAMQAAVPAGIGSMAAILGLEFDTVAEVAREAAEHTGEVCQAANDNGAGQVVISGMKDAVAWAMARAKEKGAKRTVLLPVSAPFHSALMQPAAGAMRAALADVELKAPIVPLVANTKAAAVTDPEEIRQRLVDQVTGTVRWRESMHWMADQGVTTFLEIGAGKVLATLAKRMLPEARTYSVEGDVTFENLHEYLNAHQKKELQDV